MNIDSEKSSEHNLVGWPDEVVGAQEHVPLLDGSCRRYVNLDNAATAPPLVAVQQAVDAFLPWYSSVHRGSGFKSQLSTYVYEEARTAIARFVGADPAYHSIVFTKNSTESLNKVADLMAQTKSIVFMSVMEHHANMLTWRFKASDVRYVAVDDEGVIDRDDLKRQLRSAPSGRQRLLAISGAYNVTGYAPPIHDLARIAHENGALILVDGAQLVPHREVRIQGIGTADRIDFLVFSGHKLYAPFGSGVLVLPRGMNSYRPTSLGGGIVELVTLHDVVWSDLPDREEAGSPNTVGIVAMWAAAERLQQLGMANLSRHEETLASYLLTGSSRISGFRLLGPRTMSDRVGVIAFVVKDIPHALIASVLALEWGVGVRSGCFCAHPGMLRLLQVSDADVGIVRRRLTQGNRSAVPGAVRASFGLYNSIEDVDRFIEGLEAIAAGKIAGSYVEDAETGEFVPRNWSPDFASYFDLHRIPLS